MRRSLTAWQGGGETAGLERDITGPSTAVRSLSTVPALPADGEEGASAGGIAVRLLRRQLYRGRHDCASVRDVSVTSRVTTTDAI